MTKFLLAAILALGTTTMAFAAPVKMTDNQLDQVTAGASATIDLRQLIALTNLPTDTTLTLTLTEIIKLVLTTSASSTTPSNKVGEIEAENSAINRGVTHGLEHAEGAKQSGVHCRR